MASTALLIKPTIQECRKAAVAEGMPEREGDKFFYHYESNGWKVGRLPMKSFLGSMGGWRMRWEDRGCPGKNGNGATEPIGGAVMIVKQKEYERVLARMKTIVNSYDSHQDLRANDQREMALLRKRRDELKKDLGVMI